MQHHLKASKMHLQKRDFKIYFNAVTNICDDFTSYTWTLSYVSEVLLLFIVFLIAFHESGIRINRDVLDWVRVSGK